MLPLFLALACSPSDRDVLTPSAAEARPPAESPPWGDIRPLDGVERLFTGPFRCALPQEGAVVVDFHPRAIARGTTLRGRWTHRERTLTMEWGAGAPLEHPYEPFSQTGIWWLAGPGGAMPCKLGHEAELPSGGHWIRVVDTGGDVPAAGLHLADLPGVGLVTLDEAPGTSAAGLRLQHRADQVDSARALGQAIADRLTRPVTLVESPEVRALTLEVGG